MKNYAYCRVSTELQESSLEVQRAKILDYCKFKQWEEPEFIVDLDVSGKLPILQRPEGKKLIDIRDANIISVKIDRLFRNVSDSLTMLDEWRSRNVNIILTDVGGSQIDTSKAIGRMIFTSIVSFAEFERNLISERTSDSLQHKKKTGKKYAKAVFGFDILGCDLVENPQEQQWVQRIFTMKANKKTLQQIANRLNGAGVRPKSNGVIFYPSTVDYILKNDIYEN